MFRNSRLWDELIITSRTSRSLVSAYLARSGQASLSITLDFRKEWGKDDNPAVVLDDLAQHSTRWHQFVFMTLFDAVDTQFVMRWLHGLPTPQLESLRLLFKQDHMVAQRSAYKRRHLRPKKALPRRRPVHIGAAPSVLKTLEICCLDNDDHPNIFELKTMVDVCPSLTNLTIQGSVLDLKNTPISFVIDIPSLKFLSIGPFLERGSDNMYALLNSVLFVPNLETLELSSLLLSEWASFARYISKGLKFPLLRTLILLDVDLPLNNIPRWLPLGLPGIRHLTVLGVRGLGAWMQCLLPKNKVDNDEADADAPWSELESLTLPAAVNFRLMHSLVKTRIQLGVPLVKVRVQPEFLDALERDGVAERWFAERVILEEFHVKYHTHFFACEDPWAPRHLIPSIDSRDEKEEAEELFMRQFVNFDG